MLLGRPTFNFWLKNLMLCYLGNVIGHAISTHLHVTTTNRLTQLCLFLVQQWVPSMKNIKMKMVSYTLLTVERTPLECDQQRFFKTMNLSLLLSEFIIFGRLY